LSYYPIWHGKDLNVLKQKLNMLGSTHSKEILIAETAYPFTLGWNDWTNNIVGLEEQLILPDFQPTPEGQKSFLMAIRNTILETGKGIGFCYWGAELVAWKGPEAADGSPWENQALFDFENNALPALKVFGED
jgi:arabinogalactan endo-1,4-beta-galactosidase